jgi:O-antigen ligase
MTLLILFFSSHFRKFPKVLGLGVVLFLASGLVACTARGPLLSVLFVLITYSFIARTVRTSFSHKQILAGLLVFALLILPALSWVERYPAVQARVAEKEKELIAFFQGERDPGGTLGERVDYYRSASSAFAEKPLSGWGVGGWPVYFFGFEKEDYPHNLVLEIAAEQGLPGLIALFAFFGAIYVAARRIWKERPDLAFPIPLFAYSVLTCMFSGDLNTRSLWLLCGTILAISRMSIREARARSHYRYPVFRLPESASEYSQAA